MRWIGSITPECGWFDEDHDDETGEWNNLTRCGTEEKCHVQERLATIKLWCSPNFSPVISDQYLFIFVKLEEDKICLFYNLPFGQAHRYDLTSLAIGKLVLV